jgi:hypothetical protein
MFSFLLLFSALFSTLFSSLFSFLFSILFSALPPLLEIFDSVHALLHLIIDFLLQPLGIDSSQISEELEEQVVYTVLLAEVELRIPEEALEDGESEGFEELLRDGEFRLVGSAVLVEQVGVVLVEQSGHGAQLVQARHEVVVAAVHEDQQVRAGAAEVAVVVFEGVVELPVTLGVDEMVARRHTEALTSAVQVLPRERVALPYQRHECQRLPLQLRLADYALAGLYLFFRHLLLL